MDLLKETELVNFEEEFGKIMKECFFLSTVFAQNMQELPGSEHICRA